MTQGRIYTWSVAGTFVAGTNYPLTFGGPGAAYLGIGGLARCEFIVTPVTCTGILALNSGLAGDASSIDLMDTADPLMHTSPANSKVGFFDAVIPGLPTFGFTFICRGTGGTGAVTFRLATTGFRS